MNNRMLAECNRGLTRVALIEDGDLAEYYVERDGRCGMVGNVYVGKVQNVLPGMQAAFVDIGTEKNAFLYIGSEQERAMHCYSFGEGEAKSRKIAQGQEILVQVVKEPEGQKGPRVTTRVTVPGRLLVLAAEDQGIGISRRIEEEAERERLMQIAKELCPEGMGLVMRTAAMEASKEELAEELRVLVGEWDIIARKARHAKPPKCVHREDALLKRALRDLFSCKTEELLVSGEGLHETAREYSALYAPDLLDRVKLYQGNIPLFAHAGIEERADRALNRKVWLKSGGYLIFDDTEALTVIDVNSGKYVGKKDLQDTVFRVNLEAADAIARQLRLRDVGGIVIIDFIDMEDVSRQQELVERLREALKGDRNRTNVVGLTGLGLVEMTRKKTRASLMRTVTRECPYCEGGGRVYAPDQIARRALRALMLKRRSGDEQVYRLEAGEDVISAFERLGGDEGVVLCARPACSPCDYQLKATLSGDAESK